MLFFSIRSCVILSSLVLLVACYAASHSKDKDCDVPDSYHGGLGISSKCEMELNDLADRLANISRCMILAARPLTACLSCFPLRQDLERAYATIMAPSPSSCAHELLDRDSTHMVLRGYAYYTDLLAVGRCELCLKREQGGGYSLLPAVVQFMETDAAFRRCMEVEFPAHKAVNASAVLCDFCRPQYDLEQRHAKAVIQDTRNWRTCRDIIDMANTTQYIWQHHGCDLWELTFERFLQSLIPLVLAGVLITTFYCFAWRRHLRLEREEATRAAAERSTLESSEAEGPAVGRSEHLYDYDGLRRRPSVAAADWREEGESEGSGETRSSEFEDSE